MSARDFAAVHVPPGRRFMDLFLVPSWLADRIARATERDGGATFALDGTQPTIGFAVGGAGEEYVCRRDDPWYELGDYLARHASRVIADPVLFYGTWRRPDGKVVLDLVNVLQDREVALRLARERGEEAVYDLGAAETIDAYGHDGEAPA